jgi:quinol monooxygenase YgiN
VIIVAGCVDLDPGQRDAALAAAIPLLDPTREQTGCLAYVWSPDPVVPRDGHEPTSSRGTTHEGPHPDAR